MNSRRFFACLLIVLGAFFGNLRATPIPSQKPKYPKANYPKAKHPTPKPTPTRRVVNGSYHRPVVLHVAASHVVNQQKSLPLAVSHLSTGGSAAVPEDPLSVSNPGVVIDVPQGN